MAKAAPKEQWRAVRRYALSGEMRTARRILQMMVQENPDDIEAAAELQRLEAGQPLRCTETQKARQERMNEEALYAIADKINVYSTKKLAALQTKELQKLHQELKENLRTLANSHTLAPPGTNAYKKNLERELGRRHKRNLKSRMTIAAIALGTLLTLAGIAWGLYRKAASVSEQLTNAWQAQDWERTEAILEGADTGIYRMMNPLMNELIAKVTAWQQQTISRSNELQYLLQVYEKREAISTLSLEERAQFLRQIRALPNYHAKGLLLRWEELCRPEKEKLDMQRDAFLAEVKAAARFPELTGNIADDTAQLRKARATIQKLIQTFVSAKDAFDLPKDTISRNVAIQSKIDSYLADIEMLNRAEIQMRSARNYQQHFAALAELTPTQYPPALAAAKAGSKLPSEEEICNVVRAHRYKIPQNMPQEVIHAIVDKGPTFCQAYPANLQQIHLMEDIFTSRTLRQKVFEIFRASGEIHYTDQYPTVTEKNNVRFTLSELDPERKVSKSPHMEWENAHTVWIRTLDATPILKAVDLTRDKFWGANLPDLLGRLTAIHDKDCPALAKAYVYHTLLEVMLLHHKKPDILGLRYSPTLQEDIKSFRQIGVRNKLPLSITCWLSRDEKVQEAEALYAQWFDMHADRNYSAEMSKTLSRILRTRPRYIGYVDAGGQAHIRVKQAEGTSLWYISGGKLTTTPSGKPLKTPAGYSPIFAE